MIMGNCRLRGDEAERRSARSRVTTHFPALKREERHCGFPGGKWLRLLEIQAATATLGNAAPQRVDDPAKTLGPACQ
jgi:hypothetical protein